MNSVGNKFLGYYIEFLDSLEKLKKNHSFKSFEKNIKIEDNIIQPFNTLYYLLSDLKDIKSDREIIDSLFLFEKILTKSRLKSLVYRAIYLGANLSEFSQEDFDKLLVLKDKEINIILSKSSYITENLAYKLANSKSEYMVYVNLFENKSLDISFKNILVDVCKELIEDNPTEFRLLEDLVKKYLV